MSDSQLAAVKTMVTIGNDLILDAAIRETHTYDSDVTDYPVESGSSITDNVRPRPITVEIEGIVTDTPLPGPVAASRGATGADKTVSYGGGVIGGGSITIPGDFQVIPSEDALADLIAIYEAREPVSIGTTLKAYDSMVMTSLVIPRDADTGAALSFTATFQQVTIITNNRTTIKVAPPVHTGLGPKLNLGNVVVTQKAGWELIWHHSSPAPAWSTQESLGYKAADVVSGEANGGFYHADGEPLSYFEYIQYTIDTENWVQTHDENGQLLLNPTNQPTLSSIGASKNPNTIPAYDNGDGQWVDQNGKPVAYNPTYGGWQQTSDPVDNNLGSNGPAFDANRGASGPGDPGWKP